MYILIEHHFYSSWIQTTRLVILFPQYLFNPNNLRPQVLFYTMFQTPHNRSVNSSAYSTLNDSFYSKTN